MPDLSYLHTELRRAGVTLALLHMAHLEKHPNGYRYTSFCEREGGRARQERLVPSVSAHGRLFESLDCGRAFRKAAVILALLSARAADEDSTAIALFDSLHESLAAGGHARVMAFCALPLRRRWPAVMPQEPSSKLPSRSAVRILSGRAPSFKTSLGVRDVIGSDLLKVGIGAPRLGHHELGRRYS